MSDFDNANDWATRSKELRKAVRDAVFDFQFERRNNSPFWNVVEALLTTNEDQSVKLDRLQATNEAILKELRELRAKLVKE